MYKIEIQLRKTVVRNRAVMFLLMLPCIVALPDVARAAGLSGVTCQQSYENDWANHSPRAYELCGNFVDEIGDVQFYYTLVNAKDYFEDTLDRYQGDAVDLYFTSTHSGADDKVVFWAMWNEDELAYSDAMRLGDDNHGLSIFSTYSCYTLRHDHLIDRYRNVMRGGLRYVTGSHDIVWQGWTLTDVGEDYADNLNDNDSIRYAWKDGIGDWYKDQDATVMTTGRNADECSFRRNNMSWNTYRSYPVLRDGDVNYYCWTYWNNL